MKPTPTRFIHAVLPIAALGLLIGYGLVARPLLLGQKELPLEMVFVLASVFSVSQLLIMGKSWAEIQSAVIRKLASAMPVVFILFAVGIIIGAWMVSGTIPMLVVYGLELLNPRWLYLVAFLVPVVFSTLTGTSWGSVGTIGVVMMGIAVVLQANLGIAAGAIISGALFGDKLSPLSDTTNVAAVAAEVDLYDHIRSMMVTTMPSAILAAIGFSIFGFMYPPAIAADTLGTLEPFLDSLHALFNFNILLLLPPAIVLVGSITRRPTVPVLLVSTVVAGLMGFLFQDYSLRAITLSMVEGFDVSKMATWIPNPTESLVPQAVELVDRGGLYSMDQAIFMVFLVFFFIGSIETINAMPTVMDRLFAFARSRRIVILSTLVGTGFTNAMTSNQFATSFILGDAFKSRFDRYRIPRKVLSRSLEDYGTMIEPMVPWHPSSLFMVATLGVTVGEFWNWQLLTLINLIIAPTLAILGIGCFYDEMEDPPSETES